MHDDDGRRWWRADYVAPGIVANNNDLTIKSSLEIQKLRKKADENLYYIARRPSWRARSSFIHRHAIPRNHAFRDLKTRQPFARCLHCQIEDRLPPPSRNVWPSQLTPKTTVRKRFTINYIFFCGKLMRRSYVQRGISSPPKKGVQRLQLLPITDSWWFFSECCFQFWEIFHEIQSTCK